MKKLNNPTENFVSRRINQRRVRRWVALLSALVLFLTVNTLKLEADTLERIATCGIEQHVHDESCYDASGALTCGLAEHAHTDACFQQRPQRHDLTRVDGFMPLNAKVTLATPMPKLTSNSADGQDAVQAEADYYSDINRWAFPMEVFYLKERFRDMLEIKQSAKDVVQDRTIFEGVYVFARNNHIMGNLDDRDFDTYMELYESMMLRVDYPRLLVYLRTPLKSLVANIDKRGRDYERKIRAELLFASYAPVIFVSV